MGSGYEIGRRVERAVAKFVAGAGSHEESGGRPLQKHEQSQTQGASSQQLRSLFDGSSVIHGAASKNKTLCNKCCDQHHKSWRSHILIQYK